MPARTNLKYIRKEGQKPVVKHELAMQRALTAELNSLNVVFYNDVASGMYLTVGQNRTRAQLACRKGWVDLFIAEPHRGYHGAFLELKRAGTRVYKRDGSLVADEQIQKEAEFLSQMAERGYFTAFTVGYDEAIRVIHHYLELPEIQELF